MDFGTMFLMSFISVLTLLIVALRVLPWRVIIKYHWAADILFTLTLLVLLSGTITGMIIAIISGLIFSIVMSIGKLLTPQ